MRLQSLRTRPDHFLQRPLVVWALDAFSKDFESHARTAQAIRAHVPDCDIQPVYVLSEEVFSGRGYSSFLRAAIKPCAHQNLMALLQHELLAEVRRDGIVKQPRVLIESSADASKCCSKLLRYAKRKSVSLVAIGTHARSAITRWFAGSFADTLIRESKIPLLISGPKQRPDLCHPKAIIVPTDFHPVERESFSDLLQVAHTRGLTLHLFHRAAAPFDSWAQASLLGETWISVNQLFDEEKSKEARTWLAMATSADVDTRISAPIMRDSFCEALLDYARLLDAACPVIAMLNSAPAGLPARLTRDLIRTSPYPLLIAGSPSRL